MNRFAKSWALAVSVAFSVSPAPAAFAKGVEPRFDLTDPAGAPFGSAGEGTVIP